MSITILKQEAMLNCDEVAEWLRLHKSTIYTMAQQGRIPAQKVPGTKRWVFRPSEIERWLEVGR